MKNSKRHSTPGDTVVSRHVSHPSKPFRESSKVSGSGVKIGRRPVLFVDGLKPCSICGEQKPESGFHRASGLASGFQSRCKSCSRENYTPSPESERSRNLRRKYGISGEQFDEMMESQNGRCAICSVKFDGSGSKAKHGPLVDHCHNSSKVRGLICRACNFGLGKFEDDPNRLLTAAAYLLQSEDLLAQLGD